MHRVGKHKALLFEALLGMQRNNAQELRTILLEVVRTHEAEIRERDEHGQRYRLDFPLAWRDKQTMIRSVWNIRTEEDFPRLVTCYPI